MKAISDDVLIAGVQECLKNGPVELWKIEHVLGIENAAERLLEACKPSGVVITFRYPPVPCGAVMRIEHQVMKSGKYTPPPVQKERF